MGRFSRLVMIGGEDSFGPGGYYKTPVERALPVHMDIRKKGEIPSIGLGLVIDKSGSMCHTVNGVSKMDMAKEAAIRSTEILEAKAGNLASKPFDLPLNPWVDFPHYRLQ